jgi:hypothetical protein
LNRFNKRADFGTVNARQNRQAIRLQALQNIGKRRSAVSEDDRTSSIIAETKAGMNGAAPD